MAVVTTTSPMMGMGGMSGMGGMGDMGSMGGMGMVNPFGTPMVQQQPIY